MSSALGLRERKKLQMRWLIADTARRLFAERGFEQVPVAEIARAADVSEATVFNYFPTKEDLVYHRLEAFEEELLSSIRDRHPGESVLTAFDRFVTTPRGLLAARAPEQVEHLAAITTAVRQAIAAPVGADGFTDDQAICLQPPQRLREYFVRDWLERLEQAVVPAAVFCEAIENRQGPLSRRGAHPALYQRKLLAEEEAVRRI